MLPVAYEVNSCGLKILFKKRFLGLDKISFFLLFEVVLVCTYLPGFRLFSFNIIHQIYPVNLNLQFAPEFVIVSSGYDAAVGCEEVR